MSSKFSQSALRLLRPQIAFTTLAIAPASALAQDGGWTVDPYLRLGAQVTVAENAVRDDEEGLDSDGISLNVEPGITAENGDLSVTVRNRARRIEYFDDQREDLWRNLLGGEATYQTDENGAVSAFADYGWNLTTAEFPRADQLEIGGQVERRFGDEHRLRGGASWRERDYDDVARSSGSGPRLDGQYRYRLGANHYLYLDGRYESIGSDLDRRDMERFIVSTSYQRPLARDLRIRPQLSYRDLRFPGRIEADGQPRRDTILIPELSFIYSPGDWFFVSEFRYNIRNSNDQERQDDGYRIALSVSRAF